MNPPSSFVTAIDHLGIEFEPGDLERLGRFLKLLLEANTHFNLTAITDPDEAWMRHIYDGLTLVPHFVSAEATKVLDIGSGGGVPGIPLAIVLPSVQFTLLESTGKKATYLRETVERLELGNVTVINDRAEAIGATKDLRERYDIVTARAVGKLNVLLELTVPFAKVGGHVLAIKGERAADEIIEAKQALHVLHCAVVDASRTLTGTIVSIEKLRKSPRIYPRRPGEPKRVPL